MNESPTDVLIRAMEQIDGVTDVLVVTRTVEGDTCSITTYGNRGLEQSVAMQMLAHAQVGLVEGEGAD